MWYTYERQENKVFETIRFVTIDPSNLKTWSEAYADLLRSIVDDLDSVFREMATCQARGCAAASGMFTAVKANLGRRADVREWDINDYLRTFEPVYELSKNEVIVPYGLSSIGSLRPFESFAKNTVPLWWTSYNHIKHQYYEKMSEATLENVLNGLAAMLVLNSLHKCGQYYVSMTRRLRGGLRFGTIEQAVAPQYLTEQLQTSMIGLPSSARQIQGAWVDTKLFHVEVRMV